MNRKSVDLPQELIHKIFTHGAIHSNSFCHTLCQIARWTYALAYPYLYRTVAIDNLDTSKKFVNALRAPFIDHNVPNVHEITFAPKYYIQNVWLEPVSNHVVNLYRHCALSALSRLAIPADNLFWLFQASTIQWNGEVSLRHRMVKGGNDLDVMILDNHNNNWIIRSLIVEPAKMSPLWTKVTKVWLGAYEDFRNTALPEIQHLKSLTHLAIPFRVGPQQNASLDNAIHHLQPILDDPSLSHLVLVVYPDIMSEDEYEITTATIRREMVRHAKLQTIEFKSTDLRGTWEECARGTQSLWEKAEEYTRAVLQNRL